MKNVDFAYSQRLVLKHIDLSVRAGSSVGLVGPNGGGKTTLIRLLVGLLRPTRGEISIAGMDVASATRAGDVIGYLPQKCEVNAQMPLSARQLLHLCAGNTVDRERTQWLLEQVGLADLAEEPIGLLSGGQFQRLLIARALVRSPQILLLDEPTTGIDATSRQQFVALLRELKARLKLTLIMSSHDLHTVHECRMRLRAST
jgi:zinc transport system ATP-binding protein